MRKKIKDEQLIKELVKEQKNLREIANEYDVDYTNLSKRLGGLGVKKLPKVNSTSGGRYIKVDEILEKLGLSSESDVYWDVEIVDGEVKELNFYQSKWKKE